MIYKKFFENRAHAQPRYQILAYQDNKRYPEFFTWSSYVSGSANKESISRWLLETNLKTGLKYVKLVLVNNRNRSEVVSIEIDEAVRIISSIRPRKSKGNK